MSKEIKIKLWPDADAEELTLLRAENKVLQDALSALAHGRERQVNQRLHAELKALKDMLKRLEWAGGDDAGYLCPICGIGILPGDHAPDCELKAALNGKEQT